MAELMKARINADSLGELARRTKKNHPAFESEAFVSEILDADWVIGTESPDPEDGAGLGQNSACGLFAGGDDSAADRGGLSSGQRRVNVDVSA